MNGLLKKLKLPLLTAKGNLKSSLAAQGLRAPSNLKFVGRVSIAKHSAGPQLKSLSKSLLLHQPVDG